MLCTCRAPDWPNLEYHGAGKLRLADSPTGPETSSTTVQRQVTSSSAFSISPNSVLLEPENCLLHSVIQRLAPQQQAMTQRSRQFLLRISTMLMAPSGQRSPALDDQPDSGVLPQFHAAWRAWSTALFTIKTVEAFRGADASQ